MCEEFECIDCPAINTTNCYYYGKGFMDYYKKIVKKMMSILWNKFDHILHQVHALKSICHTLGN